MNNSEILIYQNPDGNIKIDVRLEDETVWLTQAQMAELFGKGRTTITEHIQNVFNEGELDEIVVCRDFRHTTQHGAIEGKTQETTTKYYNLDVIISVGYRVKSSQGTQFRIWATQRLKEYIIKGFALNDDRFKKGHSMNTIMDKATIDEVIDYLKQSLLKYGIQVDSIALFGSALKGTMDKDSDIDLIIISLDFENLDSFERAKLTMNPEIDTLKKFKVSMDIINLSPNEYNESNMKLFYNSQIVA